MKNSIKSIKRAAQAFKSLSCEGALLGEISSLIQKSKSDFDKVLGRIKMVLIEFLLFSKRETLAGPDYAPNPGWQNGVLKQDRSMWEVKK
jgi:hypothetical protein